jgi:hypothetical protein
MTAQQADQPLSGEVQRGGSFTLDTSGFVEGRPQGIRTKRVYWTDLTPFQQGYVEALFASAVGSPDFWANDHKAGYPDHVGFSDLSPEALALILRDCAQYEDGARAVGLWSNTADIGGHFWRVRQSGAFPEFPPLTVTLSDAGKVCVSPTPNERKREEEG